MEETENRIQRLVLLKRIIDQTLCSHEQGAFCSLELPLEDLLAGLADQLGNILSAIRSGPLHLKRILPDIIFHDYSDALGNPAQSQSWAGMEARKSSYLHQDWEDFLEDIYESIVDLENSWSRETAEGTLNNTAFSRAADALKRNHLATLRAERAEARLATRLNLEQENAEFRKEQGINIALRSIEELQTRIQNAEMRNRVMQDRIRVLDGELAESRAELSRLHSALRKSRKRSSKFGHQGRGST